MPVINVRGVVVTGCVDQVKIPAHALRIVPAFAVEMVCVMRMKPVERALETAGPVVGLVVWPMKPRVVRIRM
jgi:hypothetical protein